MNKKTRVDVKKYYDLGWEKDRLQTGQGHAQRFEGDVEKTRTLELLNRYLPKEPSTIIDVGGAAGAYAFWLAGLNHRVHLVDLTPLHIEQAKAEQENPGSPQLASCNVGDACDLHFPDNFADAVLCMGPLYHLPDQEERARCLSEALRVLKPGGLLFAVGISRFVPLFDFLRTGGFTDETIATMIKGDIASGHHSNPTENPMLFTTAYFHKPKDLREEIESAGFSLVDVMAIEGPILLAKEAEQHWLNTEAKEKLLAFAKQVEREPSIMGISNHIAAVGYKPKSP